MSDVVWMDSMARQLEAMPHKTFVDGLMHMAKDVRTTDDKLAALASLMILEAIRRIEKGMPDA